MMLDVQVVNENITYYRFVNIYIQYAVAPSLDNFDIKLEYIKDDLNITECSKYGFVRRNNSLIRVPRNVNYLRNENLLALRNITNFTFAGFERLHKKLLHVTFVYDGAPPKLSFISNNLTFDILEQRTSLDINFRAQCKSCLFTNDSLGRGPYSRKGVLLYWNETTFNKTVCHTWHLSTFGSFYVTPNPLPAFSIGLLKEGYVLLVTVLVFLLFWLLGFVLARRIDKQDLHKVGVVSLKDNKPGDDYLFEVTVNTGSKRHSGTQSNVFLCIFGINEKAKVHHLQDGHRELFKTGNVDSFILATTCSLGYLTCIRIWHDNGSGDWFLRSVEIVDLQNEEKYVFLVSRWLAVDKLDGRLDCIIHAASGKDLQEFNFLFTSKTRRDFSDSHLWFSVYLRPPRSPFTRCQRLSVAFSFLFTTMIASVIFYGAEPNGNPAEENRIAGFTFQWSQVYIAVISACITVPINMILISLFRSIQPNYQKQLATMVKNRYRDEKIEVETEKSKGQNGSNENNSGTSKPAVQKKKFYLPYWCLIPAWILCVVIILTSTFFVM